MNNSVLRREHFLTPSFCNAQRELPLPLLVSQIIEIATDHANDLGIGFLYMEDKGWVLSRLSVEMKRWPRVGEHYYLQTWVESWNKHFSERCFSVESKEGDVLGYARTVWMIIDLASHKSYGTAGFELPPDKIANAICPILRQQRHKPFEATIINNYIFKYTDLDYYRHVNTVRHIELLLNQFPLGLYDSHNLYRFEIAFMHEAKYGDKVELRGIREDMRIKEFNSDNEKDAESYTFGMFKDEEPILRSRLFFIKEKEA